MCFGGGGSQPQAQVTTPAVPVSDITAGHPTVTVSPSKEGTGPAAPSSPATQKPPASQSKGSVGLSGLGM